MAAARRPIVRRFWRVENLKAEYDRLVQAGVQFTQPPISMGPVSTAVFDDTCGNLIQIAQRH